MFVLRITRFIFVSRDFGEQILEAGRINAYVLRGLFSL